MPGIEIKKRKVTIFYEDCPYMGENGLVTIDAWVQSHTHELDGIETILIRTDPTHEHPVIKELVLEEDI